MWKGRFEEEASDKLIEFTQSLDLDWTMALHDIAGSMAHAVMLYRVGLLKKEEAAHILEGLRQIRDEISEGLFKPEESLEDVHMNIEKRLIDLLGDTGARLHTGRSRNDQTATTLRLFMRDALVDLGYKLVDLLKVLTFLAEKHKEVVIPGYTHLQQAQPISLGHYWMSHYAAFKRDAFRLLDVLEALNECPLGAGALAGSTLPLDRNIPAELLNFQGVTANSLDTVASRDHLLDYHYLASRFVLHCSRLAEDMIIYNTREFGWIILPDAFCTGSSMMPQKKNPDVLELVRGKTGQVLGYFLDLMVNLKGLPLTYNRDLQEDKRGLHGSFKVLGDILDILPHLLALVEVDEKRALSGLAKGMSLATDVAEYLVTKGVPFRESHWKVGSLVKWCIHHGKALEDLTISEWKEQIPEVTEDILPLMDLHASVESRATDGGTSPSRVLGRVEMAKKEIEEFLPLLKGFEFDTADFYPTL